MNENKSFLFIFLLFYIFQNFHPVTNFYNLKTPNSNK